MRLVNAQAFPELLASALREDAARPLVTFYDDATGERVELSVTSYANWVAKTSNLLQDEFDIGRGSLILVDLPTHWLGPVWLGASWSVGAEVTDDPALEGAADVILTGPGSVDTYAGTASAAVVALSLRPLGAPFAEPLPPGVTDFAEVVPAQPDHFVSADPPQAVDPAWRGGPAFGELVEEASGFLPGGGRLLTDLNPCSRAGLLTVVAPLLAGGGTAWVRNPSPERWAHHAETERIATTIRGQA